MHESIENYTSIKSIWNESVSFELPGNWREMLCKVKKDSIK